VSIGTISLALREIRATRSGEPRHNGELCLVAGVTVDFLRPPCTFILRSGKADHSGRRGRACTSLPGCATEMAISRMATVRVNHRSSRRVCNENERLQQRTPLQLSIARYRALKPADRQSDPTGTREAVARRNFSLQAQNEHSRRSNELLNEAGQFAARQGDEQAEKALHMAQRLQRRCLPRERLVSLPPSLAVFSRHDQRPAKRPCDRSGIQARSSLRALRLPVSVGEKAEVKPRFGECRHRPFPSTSTDLVEGLLGKRPFPR